MNPFDDAWLEQLNPRDALRVLAAWDRLRLHTPAAQRPITYLHQHTRLPIRLLTPTSTTPGPCAPTPTSAPSPKPTSTKPSSPPTTPSHASPSSPPHHARRRTSRGLPAQHDCTAQCEPQC